MKIKNKTKPVIFIYLVIAILFVGYIARILPLILFLALTVYCSLYIFILKEKKIVKILIDLVILNFLIAYENLSQLIKRKLKLISRSLLFLKILIFLDYKLPKLVHSILLFLNVKLPRQIRRAVKLILKTIIHLVIGLLELIYYSVTKLLDLINSFILKLYKKAYSFVYSVLLFLNVKLPRRAKKVVKLVFKIIAHSIICSIELIIVPFILKSLFVIKSIAIKSFKLINSFTSQLSSIFNYLTTIYLSKRASLTRFAGIVLFVLIILFFFIGVKPGEETIKFVGAVGEACTYDLQCTELYTSFACDAENTANEGLEGQENDNLVCFNQVACYGGSLFCGSQDGHCQADAGAASNCDDYPEMSSILSGDPGYPGYCDSNCAYHTIGTYKFYVKNSAGTNRASFDDAGNVVITGTLFQSSATAPSGNDDFIVQNSAGTWKAWVDGATGNMYLAGTMADNQAISPPANSFIIQNSGGTAVSYIDSNGNLRLSGAFVAGGTP